MFDTLQGRGCWTPRARSRGLWALSGALGLCLLGCADRTPEGFVGSGILEAEEVVVSSQVPGTLLRVPFAEGDRVQAGDTLAVVDVERIRLQIEEAGAAARVAEAQIAQSEAGLAAAREERAAVVRRADRVRLLDAKGSATEQDLDDLETRERIASHQLDAASAAREAAWAQRERARAALSLLERTARDAAILAPRAGTVITRFLEPGELVSPGIAVVKLADLEEIRILVYVPVGELSRVRVGDEARIFPEGMAGEPVRGRIAWISPEAEFTPRNVQTRDARADLVFAVRVIAPNPDGRLKPGLPADVAWSRLSVRERR